MEIHEKPNDKFDMDLATEAEKTSASSVMDC